MVWGRSGRAWLGGALTAGLVLGSFGVPGIARADTMPVDSADARTPVTVTADPLPTVQIDGVAWTQVVVDDTVYVGGSFTAARPAGAAPGVNQTARLNLLAYDLTTGNLIDGWAPQANGVVKALAVSPDKSRIYVGGEFSEIGGLRRNRLAAVDATSGAVLTAFEGQTSGTVEAIAASADAVYVGGALNNAVLPSGFTVARKNLAAFSAADGTLLSWAPQAYGRVRGLALSPDGSKLALAGSFDSINLAPVGDSEATDATGRGLAFVSAEGDGRIPMALPANLVINNHGDDAAFTSVVSDGGDGFYVTAYRDRAAGDVRQGEIEGGARIDWASGRLVWLADCQGGTYDAVPMDGVLYSVGRNRDCAAIQNGFPETAAAAVHPLNAFSATATGALTRRTSVHTGAYAGTPAPNLVAWQPKLGDGTYTGQNQAAWTVAGNGAYLAVGGEFPTVGLDARPQQGLVRYAMPAVATVKQQGPLASDLGTGLTATSSPSGAVHLSWNSFYDIDNENLTYAVIRDADQAHPVCGFVRSSFPWRTPRIGCVDSGPAAGSSHSYRVLVSDPDGNTAESGSVRTTVNGSGAASAYAKAVVADGADSYWRLGAATRGIASDSAGGDDAIVGAGVTLGQKGAIAADGDLAAAFSGGSRAAVVARRSRTTRHRLSVEAWVKTRDARGGEIVGIGDSASGDGRTTARALYLNRHGRVSFGVLSGRSPQAIEAPGRYDDGRWHHLVGTVDEGGAALYVDGVRVGVDRGLTPGGSFTGHWHIGGDDLTGWPGEREQNHLTGVIDEVAVYSTALSPAQVRRHYVASGRVDPGPARPSDDYAAAVTAGHPWLYWRLDGATNPVRDASGNGHSGVASGRFRWTGDSAVGTAEDGSIALDDETARVAQIDTAAASASFAAEFWFKAPDATAGGRLIEFGKGTAERSSANPDRVVSLLADRHLRFGSARGGAAALVSSAAYADGAWHHVVAQQDGRGMKLYVDGELDQANAVAGGRRIGEGRWGLGGHRNPRESAGRALAVSIDEVAVYPRALRGDEVRRHFVAGGGRLANRLPDVEFASRSDGLTVAFDATGSADPDGDLTAYAWDFGDGDSGEGKSPSHTYRSGGEYTVRLNVTDDSGGVSSLARTVSVTGVPVGVYGLR